jgi:tetratricopeptide (TPR) repeat protein
MPVDRPAEGRGPGALPQWQAAAGPASPEFAPGDLIYQRYMVQAYTGTDTNEVYFCLEMGTWVNVVVKIPRPHPAGRTGEDQSRIFYEEVQNWAGLGEHPNLVRCHYAAVRDGRWFLVLEWVGAPGTGKNLEDYSRSDLAVMDGPARLAEIVRLSREICDGLAYIHANGIVHGDLKPQNVLIDKNGRAKITDLGRGSRFSPGTPSGSARVHMSRARAAPQPATPEYTAPELWEGRSAGTAADIYALGCILYELAAGRRPFQAPPGADLAQWAKLHRKHLPPDVPNIPEPFRRLIADCLHKNPSRRPVAAAEVRTRLTELLPPEDGQAPQDNAGSEEGDDGQGGYGLLPWMRSELRWSLLAAAGRAEDAAEQMTAAIREQMASVLAHGNKYVSDKPSSGLAGSFNDRGALVGVTDGWIPSTGDFMTAIRLDPQFAAPYANLGTNWQRIGCPTIAIVAFNRAIELDPDDYRLYLKRARLLSSCGWDEPAHRDYERAVTIAPDDPDACDGMADSLAALGRGDEVLQYRAKGRQPGDDTDDAPGYLRRGGIDRQYDLMGKMMTAMSIEDDHDAAIAAYTSVLTMAPWETDMLYYLGKERLGAADPGAAADDLRAFLDRASTTHPLAPKARALLRQASEDAGIPAGPDDEVYPNPKPPGYIARKTQGQPHTLSLVNLLPLGAEQRLVLLDMLYAGPPSRKYQAGRLLWSAYIEYNGQLRSRNGRLARKLGDEAWRETAGRFTAAQIATEIAISNGFGIPVLLAEVQLSPNPLHDLRFSGSPAPSLGWASSGAVGVWEVIPGVQTDRLVFDEPRQAPLFADGRPGHLIVGDDWFSIHYQDTERQIDEWNIQGSTILAACFYDHGLLAVGTSSGRIVFFDPDEARATQIVRLDEGERDFLDGMRLWQCDDGTLMAFTGAAFYRIGPRPDESAALAVTKPDTPWPGESARLLHASRARIIWKLSRDELLVARLDEPGTAVKLTASDSTDEGFTAAAASTDGTVVAAICGSFLHIWWKSTGEADYVYLGLTPQQQGRSIAVSADGRYIAVGTNAGSALVYVTRSLADP